MAMAMASQLQEDEEEQMWVPTWQESAVEDQQQLYEMLGDRSWDLFQHNEDFCLAKKVGYALYGPPQATPSRFYPLGYEDKKCMHINKLYKAIIEVQKADMKQAEEKTQGEETHKEKDLLMSIMFFIVKLRDTSSIAIPMFRIPKYKDSEVMDNEYKFMDSNGKAYDGWNEYLTSTRLQDSEYCYPINGTYLGDKDGNVYVDSGFQPTPALSSTTSFTKSMLGIMAVGGSAVGMTALITATAPVTVPVAGVLGLAGVASGMVGGLTHGLLHGFYSRRDLNVRNWLNSERGVAPCNGLGLVSGLRALVEKNEAGFLTALDLFQFSTTLFFFTNLMVTIPTLEALVKRNDRTVMRSFTKCFQLNKGRKVFRRASKTTRKDNLLRENAKATAGVNHILNMEAFLSVLTRLDKVGERNVTHRVELNLNLVDDRIKVLVIKPETHNDT